MNDNINVDMNNKTEDVENSDESDNVKETLEDVVLRSWGNSSNSRSNLHALLVREQTGGKRYWPLRYDILRLFSCFKLKNNPNGPPSAWTEMFTIFYAKCQARIPKWVISTISNLIWLLRIISPPLSYKPSLPFKTVWIFG